MRAVSHCDTLVNRKWRAFGNHGSVKAKAPGDLKHFILQPLRLAFDHLRDPVLGEINLVH
jgi:hypothetical protein